MTDEVITCSVSVSAVDQDGNIKETTTKEADLFTDNFGKLMAAWFGKPRGSNPSAVSAAFVRTDGATQSANIYFTSVTYEWAYSPGGIYVGVGNASTPPTRADYVLGAQVGSWRPTLTSSTWITTSGAIVFTGDILVNISTEITECGVLLGYINPSNQSSATLLMHDSFGTSAVNMQSGDYARVSYTINI